MSEHDGAAAIKSDINVGEHANSELAYHANPTENNIIRMSVSAAVGMLLGIVWAIILGISVTLGGGLSLLLGAGVYRAWAHNRD